MLRTALCALFALICCATAASAQAVVWVDGTNGSDATGDGSESNPYLTIQFAYDQAAGGDTLLVQPGDYAECVVLAGIAVDKPVAIVARDWLINGDNTTTRILGDGSCTTVIIGGTGAEIQGFTVRDAGFTGIFGFGSVTITHNLVRDNTSTYGAGIYVYSATCYYGDTESVVSNNTVTNNHAEFDAGVVQGGDGGGIYIFAVGTESGGALGCSAGDATVTVSHNVIDGNDADNALGGGLVVFTNTAPARRADVLVTQNTITNNFALSFSFGYGGGAWLTTYGYGTEEIVFTNNTVDGNSASGDGGGVSAWINTLGQAKHTIAIDSNTVTGNAADGNGGGLDLFVFADELDFPQSVSMVGSNNTVTSNTSAGSLGGGGGILGTFLSRRSASPDMELSILGNVVTENLASVSGGGIGVIASADADPFLDGNTSPAIADVLVASNIVADNEATGAGSSVGGGVFAYAEAFGDADAGIDLTLNTVAGNAADRGAGGVELESFTDFDTTFFDEGLVRLRVRNSIVAKNAGIGVGGPLPGTGGTVAFPGSTANVAVNVDYNDLFANQAGDYENWIVPGANDIYMDPLLDANYRPGCNSPVIDAGDPLFTGPPAADIDGGPRIFDGDGDGVAIVDIGADELDLQTNPPPMASAGVDQESECSSAAGATVTLDGSSSTDPDCLTGSSDIVAFDWFEDFGLPAEIFLGSGEVLDAELSLGGHAVTLRVTDSAGQTDTDEVTVTVVDSIAPTIELSTSPPFLWPPNHKMRDVGAQITIDDICGAADFVLVSITSNEPDDAPGNQDGSTVDDIQDADIGQADLDFRLRAERSVRGSGRIYTAVYRAMDGAGNSSEATAEVLVPRTGGDRPRAIRDGAKNRRSLAGEGADVVTIQRD